MGWLILILIVVLVVLFSRGSDKKSRDKDMLERQTYAARIDYLASLPQYNHDRQWYLAISRYVLDGTMPPVRTGLEPAQSAQVGQTSAVPLKAQLRPDFVPHTVSLDSPSTSAWSSKSVGEAMSQLDNINVLLYLGAFLVVVSAGIFVGYNYGELSGTFKTVFLSIFAALFYITGLVLSLRSQKLKPAGASFTAIGMIFIPLVGLAAYKFIAPEHWRPIWLITSLVTLAIYLYTFRLLHKTYIAYLMAFTSLSLFESAISLVGLPVYYLAWGMSIMAIAGLMYAKYKGRAEELTQPFYISAGLFLPISLFLSIFIGIERGWGQTGITILLGAVFYVLASQLAEKPDEQVAYFALGVCLVPIGSWLIWSTVVGSQAQAAIVAVESLVLLGMAWLYRAWSDRRIDVLGVVAGSTILISSLLVLDDSGWLIAVLFLSLLANVVTAVSRRNILSAILAGMALLSLPLAITGVVLPDQWHNQGLVCLYLAVAAGVMALPYSLPSLTGDLRLTVSGIYLVAFAMALGYAAFSGSLWVAVVAVIEAAAAYAVSYLENEYRIAAGTPLLVIVASLALAVRVSTGTTHYTWFVLAATLLMYGISFAVETARGRILRFGAIGGMYLSIFTSYESTLVAALAAALAGATTLFESRLQQNKMLRYVGSAMLIVSLNLFSHWANISQSQAYTIPWSVYTAWLAWQMHQAGKGENRDLLAAVSLAVFTLPLASQSLSEGGQLYGLELILVSLALVMIGVGIRYRLMWAWGATALVVEVLYQMRDILYAVPKYLISAGLGVALLATAIILLQRRNDQNGQ